jgi:hypothetical protein
MAARWNGTSWTSVFTPTPDNLVTSQLNAIDGTSPNDLWAVGQRARTNGSSATSVLRTTNG